MQTGFARPEQVMACAAAWASDRSRGLAERLGTEANVGADELKLIERLVDAAVSTHGGPDEALAAVGGSDVALRSLGPVLAADATMGALSDTVEASMSVPPELEETVTSESSGRYRYDGSELGRGGIGRVLLHFDGHLRREVAIKELHFDEGSKSAPRSGSSRSSRVRFVREARVTGQLQHPNIVPVHELGQRPDGTLYYTMKVVRGRTLSDALHACTSLAERLHYVDAFHDVCNALAYAHSRGVVHRDLKPDNIMLGQFGETVVVDWGLAYQSGEEDLGEGALARDVERLKERGAHETLDGAAIGTPAYMSPEQAAGRVGEIDGRSDVYGLGAILYEILVGQPPFGGDHAFEIIARVIGEEAPPVSARAPDAPPDLAAIVDKAVSKDPVARYQSAGELAVEISAWLEGRQVGAYGYSSLELVRRFVARNKLVSALSLALLVGLVGATGAIYEAYTEAQGARDHAMAQTLVAETQTSAAMESQHIAQETLAEAFIEKADRALDEGDPAAAAVFAAAALLNDPDNPSSPHFHDSGPAHPDQERVLRADSRLRDANSRRRYRFVRNIDIRSSREGRQVVASLATSPDGDEVAWLTRAGDVGVVTVEGDESPRWLARAGDEAPATTDVMRMIDWSRRGARLAVADGTEAVRIFSPGGELVARLVGPSSAHGVAFSPDGERVATVHGDGALALWSVAEAQRLETHTLSPRPLGSVAWSRDGGRLVLSGLAPEALLWDVGTQQVVGRRPLSFWARAVDVSQDGQRAAAVSLDSHVHLFGADDGPAPRVADTQHRPVSLDLSDDGELLVHGSVASTAVLRSTSDLAVLERLHGPRFGVTNVGLAQSGRRVVAAGSSGSLRVWQRGEEAAVERIAHGGVVTAFALAPDGLLLASASSGDGLRLLRLAAQNELAVAGIEALGHAETLITELAFSPDQRRLAFITRDGRVVLRGLADGVEQELAPADSDIGGVAPVLTLAFDPSGERLYYSLPDGAIGRWNLLAGQAEAPLLGHKDLVFGLAFSPDGARLASVSADSSLRIWPLGGGEPRVFEDHEGLVSGVSFSPDGQHVATSGADHIVRLWDAATGDIVSRFEGHRKWVNEVLFSPDGRYLLTGADDETARLWNVETGRAEMIFRRDGFVFELAFSADGHHIFLNGGRELSRFVVDAADRDRDPARLLDAAERAAGVRLEGLELVPIDE